MTKKLWAAIAALVASVVLCVGVCLAWFAVNQETQVDGPSGSVVDPDIVNFTVTAYYLDARSDGYVKSSDGNVETLGGSYEVDSAPKGVLNAPIGGGAGNDEMRPYNMVTTYATAILLEVDYELRITGKNYKIFASCPTAELSQKTVTIAQDNTQHDVYKSALSNAVYFTGATESSGVYSKTNGKTSLVAQQSYGKYDEITLARGVVATGPAGERTVTGKLLFVLDYDTSFLNYLYKLIASEGGSRNSRLDFNGDISIGIKEYDPANEVVPASIAFTSGVTTQEQGANTLLSGWTFTVTYSDGSTKTVAGSDYAIYANMNTLVAQENKVATVTYNEDGVSVSTTVTYTITERAHDHIYGDYSVTLTPTKTTTGTASSVCAICGDTLSITLPVLTNSGYTITGNTAKPGVAGQGTYTITVNGVTVSFVAATDALPQVSVTGVTLSPASESLDVGGTVQLTATVSPSNAGNKAVTWSTSNANIATVSSTGLVTAVGAGNATITVTTDDGGHTATCAVTVSSPVQTSTIPASGADCLFDSAHVTGNGTNITVANNSGISNSTKAPAATLTLADGSTLGVSAGQALKLNSKPTVSFTTETEMKLYLYLATGTGVVQTLRINGADYSGTEADGYAVIETTLPAGDYSITYNGSESAIYYMEVVPVAVPVTGVTLSPTSETLDVGGTVQLTATVSPSDAANKAVTWSTSNAGVATVSNTGLVTAVGAGNATITVTTADGGHTATCAVTVTVPQVAVTGVTLSPTSESLDVGGTVQLTATVSPSNATDKTVSWTTSNAGVATVSNTGLVTAVASGSATITVTTTDGNHTATCTVTVRSSVQASAIPATGASCLFDSSHLEGNGTNIIVASNSGISNSTKAPAATLTLADGSTLGVSAGQALKLNSKPTISFTTETEMKLYLYLATGTGVVQTLRINGADYSGTEADGYAVVETTLPAGDYSITYNGSESAIYYMEVVPVSGGGGGGGDVETTESYDFAVGNKVLDFNSDTTDMSRSSGGVTMQNGYCKITKNGGGYLTLTVKNVAAGSSVTITVTDRNGKTGTIPVLSTTNLTDNGDGSYTVTAAGDIVFTVGDDGATDYYFASAAVTVTTTT